MKPGIWILIAACFGFLGVALGAFGAHALQERFGDYEKGIWQTAVQYHLLHAVVLLAFGLALAAIPNLGEIAGTTLLSWTGGLFVAGILIFSGSLYALALSGVRVLGAITPIGGLAFLSGWVLLGLIGIRLAGR
jgi:uncharacterized membrane protein YgdD (TMEM256/DUF423 family)